MGKVLSLLRLAANGTDDEVAEVVEEIHPRAVRKVADFLKQVSDEEAFCGFEFKKESFKFTSLEQVTSSSQRLQDQNIRESKEIVAGEFQGVLPSSRQFEFKKSLDASILRGKIGLEIYDADQLNRDYLHKPVQVNLKVIQVGKARPRYLLETLSDITP